MDNETSQRISQLRGKIAGAEKRKADAEKNIRQLTALYTRCDEYQNEFESARTIRKTRLNDFRKISGQSNLTEAYGDALGELLGGSGYISAYRSMDMAKSEISREMDRQRQIINECNNCMAAYNSSIQLLETGG